MKKKILAGVMAGCVLLCFTACNKGSASNGRPDKHDRADAAEEAEDVADEADEAEDAAAETTKKEEEILHFLYDVNDKDTLRELIDGAMKCEPCAGECNEDVMDKLNAVFTPTVARYGWYGEDCQMYFKYDPCVSGEYEDCDHVLYVGYDGYETEDIDGEDYIVSYEKVYAHEARPGITTIWIEIYDKDRAVTCWNNARDILANEVFPDAVLDTSWEDRYQLMYGEGVFDWYAVISCKQVNNTNKWVVCIEITLGTPELMVAETEPVESSDVN